MEGRGARETETERGGRRQRQTQQRERLRQIQSQTYRQRQKDRQSDKQTHTTEIEAEYKTEKHDRKKCITTDRLWVGRTHTDTERRANTTRKSYETGGLRRIKTRTGDAARQEHRQTERRRSRQTDSESRVKFRLSRLADSYGDLKT